MRQWANVTLKALLLLGLAVSILSYGGLLIFTFPGLAIGMWWAIRRSGSLERAGWTAVGGLAAGLWAWEIAFPVHEGDTSAGWFVAGSAAGIMVITLAAIAPRFSLRASPSSTAGEHRGADGS
jgi:hypothetical protein